MDMRRYVGIWALKRVSARLKPLRFKPLAAETIRPLSTCLKRGPAVDFEREPMLAFSPCRGSPVSRIWWLYSEMSEPILVRLLFGTYLNSHKPVLVPIPTRPVLDVVVLNDDITNSLCEGGVESGRDIGSGFSARACAFRRRGLAGQLGRSCR